MAVLFSNHIIVQTFQNKDNLHKIKHYSNVSRCRETKTYDGPNDFSMLWNQILISWEKNIIQDSSSLQRNYDKNLLKVLSKNIIHHLDKIIYTFMHTDKKVISLYYDTYRVVYYDGVIERLTILKQIINDL